MKIRYDADADAMYLDFGRRTKISETRELAPDYLVDLDARGNSVGLEILAVSEKTNLRKAAFQIDLSRSQFDRRPASVVMQKSR